MERRELHQDGEVFTTQQRWPGPWPRTDWLGESFCPQSVAPPTFVSCDGNLHGWTSPVDAGYQYFQGEFRTYQCTTDVGEESEVTCSCTIPLHQNTWSGECQ